MAADISGVNVIHYLNVVTKPPRILIIYIFQEIFDMIKIAKIYIRIVISEMFM